MNDDRFSAMYTSHLFNIDPTDPKFKRTKGMEAFISEKTSRRQQLDTEKVKHCFKILLFFQIQNSSWGCWGEPFGKGQFVMRCRIEHT